MKTASGRLKSHNTSVRLSYHRDQVSCETRFNHFQAARCIAAEKALFLCEFYFHTRSYVLPTAAPLSILGWQLQPHDTGLNRSFHTVVQL